MIKIKLMPYEKIKDDFNKVFRALQNNAIVLIDGKLSPEEEAFVIEDTMRRFSEKFSGIELSSLSSPEMTNFDKVKNLIAEKLTGRRRGFTIIGPANVVRKIKKNPDDLLVYM
jgi:hypothetical protein